jgi:iron complex outermembrane receptor protein
MKNNIKISLVLASLLSSLYAQDTVILEPLTVDSTAIKTDELRSTDAVEIYTAQDIQKAHVQNIYEFLNEQTSVVTMPSYGNPFTQLLDFHGYGTSNGNENIVVTINGRKINNIDSVPQLLSGISPESIERIEIIKSSGIVTAGDGANAGVINIITKKNSNEKSVTFYGGTYGVADGSFSFNHSDNKLSISASGEAQKSDGIRTIDANGGKDASRLSNGTFNLDYTPNEKLELHLGGSFARTDVIYGGSMTKDQYTSNPTQFSGYTSHQLYDTDSINAGASYALSPSLSLHIDAGNERKKSNYVPSWSGPSLYTYNTGKISLDYTSDALSLTLGYDGFYGQREQAGNTFNKNNNAGFIMSALHFGNSTFKLGYRFEKVDYSFADQGLNTSKNLHGVELGYNYALSKESSVFANYSHSYQAPDIDRFFGFNSSTWQTYFSGALNPMEANNYTLGYNNIQKENKFKLSLYYIDLKDEIFYYADYSGPTSSKNTNIDKSHKYGLDLSDKYIINDEFNVVLNYNYVQAIIDKEINGVNDYAGNKLPGVSNHNVKATLSYLPNEHATFALTEVYRSEAYAADDFANNFSQKQDAYVSTDISATYTQKTWEIFAKINNLFNQKNGLWIYDDAIYPVNYTTTAMAGFKLKF